MTDANPGNWPDPERPGFPANPEQDGWHWVRNKMTDVVYPDEWHSESAVASCGWGDKWVSPDTKQWLCDYLGPCLTPAETLTRYIVFASDDADDMEYPESTAIPLGIYDLLAEAQLAVDEGTGYAYHAILEVGLTVTKVVVNTGKDA